MKLLFLILNYKTYKDTITLAKNLYNYGLDDKYVLIVDNSSPNESYAELTKELAGYDNIEVIASDINGGYAKGNNYGLRYAKKYEPKYVCIINNDVSFSMETIDHLCEWYQKIPSVAFIAPKQMRPNGEEALFRNMDVPNLWTDLFYHSPFNNKYHQYIENSHIKGVHQIGLIPGAFIFTEYDVFENLGFFDESTFLFCEERFIAKKAQLAGLDSYIILNDSYVHNHSTTINKEASLRQQRRMILNGRCSYHKKYSKFPLLSVLLLKVAFIFKEVLLRIFR